MEHKSGGGKENKRPALSKERRSQEKEETGCVSPNMKSDSEGADVATSSSPLCQMSLLSDSLPFSLDRFALLRTIAQNRYGSAQVFIARDLKSEHLCVLKALLKKPLLDSPGTWISEKEILTLAKTREFPFLLHAIGGFQTPNHCFFVLPLCRGGDLERCLTRHSRFSEEKTKFYTASIVLAFEFLHSHRILYRDLKLENVLMDLDGYIKLGDFGLSRMNTGPLDVIVNICGTLEYFARRGYTRAVDWWALGVLVYEMLTGRRPFHTKVEIREKKPQLPNNLFISKAISVFVYADFPFDNLLKRRVPAPYQPEPVCYKVLFCKSVKKAEIDERFFDRKCFDVKPSLETTEPPLSPREQKDFADFDFVF